MLDLNPVPSVDQGNSSRPRYGECFSEQHFERQMLPGRGVAQAVRWERERHFESGDFRCNAGILWAAAEASRHEGVPDRPPDICDSEGGLTARSRTWSGLRGRPCPNPIADPQQRARWCRGRDARPPIVRVVVTQPCGFDGFVNRPWQHHLTHCSRTSANAPSSQSTETSTPTLSTWFVAIQHHARFGGWRSRSLSGVCQNGDRAPRRTIAHVRGD